MQPQALPGGERLSRVLQHPQLVEEHHVEEHQQDQAAGEPNQQQHRDHRHYYPRRNPQICRTVTLR